jgi:5-methylcytosine-specific restriction endonuclease McrA
MIKIIPNVNVLSTGYEPLYTTSWQEAMGDICKGRVEVVETHPSVTIGHVDGPIPFPVTVRFVKGVFVGAIKGRRKPKKPTRRNLYIRDKGECQYCGDHIPYHASTRDHVIPKSKNGPGTWENLVLSCEPCNFKKADTPLHESGMQLRKRW